jgi:His-Xaa-Ser system protein HxsD
MPLDQPCADGGACVTVTFSREAFDVEAIKRAAYRFSDRVAVEFDVGERTIECKLRAFVPLESSNLETLSNEFRTEVLDQDLRIKIASETESVRNLILSLAFSKTGLQG